MFCTNFEHEIVFVLICRTGRTILSSQHEHNTEINKEWVIQFWFNWRNCESVSNTPSELFVSEYWIRIFKMRMLIQNIWNDNAQSEIFHLIVIVQVIIGWDRDTTIYSSNEKLLKFNDLKVHFSDHSEQNQWAVACKHTPPNSEIICVQNVGTKVVCGIIFFNLKKIMLKIWKRSWEPFRSYLLNSTANPAHFHSNWAELAVLFSR